MDEQNNKNVIKTDFKFLQKVYNISGNSTINVQFKSDLKIHKDLTQRSKLQKTKLKIANYQ